MAMHFDLIDFRLLINIAETNSITGGADRSCISLPAASTRIKRFEESLDLKLMYRTAQGVTLTPPGQVILKHARTVHQQLEQLRGDLQDYVDGLKGTVRIYANTTATAEFLPAVLPKFLASHPDVNVDLAERVSQDIVRAVGDGAADIGIVAGNVRTENLDVIKYRDDKLVLVTAPDHELAKSGEMLYQQTLNYEHVCLHESSAISAFLSSETGEYNRPMKVRIRVSNFETACRLIASNVAIGILPESCARRHAQTMALSIVPLADKWALRQLLICAQSFARLPVFAREFVDLLVLHGSDTPA